MPSVEELLSQNSENEYIDISPINDVITIDPETRTINIPASETLFGTEQEMNVERKYFKCPKIVGDNIDLSKHQIYIMYITAKDSSGTFLLEDEAQSYYCEDMAVDGDYITFSWLLSGNVLNNHGFIAFAVSAKHMDGEVLKTRWKTKPAVGTVLLTVPDGEAIEERYPDIITQLLDRMNAVEEIATVEAMQGYVDDYLGRNPVQLDPTLTDSTKAAPADLVGKLKGDLSNEQTARVQVVTAERERAIARENEIEELFSLPTEEAVAKWLDEHPEATTTVQDHSLTIDKMVIGTLGYVTPEMFGAVGDGVTDDTVAIQNAINYGKTNKKRVVLTKKYLVSTLVIKRDTFLSGEPYAVIVCKETSSNLFILDNGVVTSGNYDLTIENLFILAKSSNTDQHIFHFEAINGGLWHATLRNIVCSLNGENQVGLYLYASDYENGKDVANQYLRFENLCIYKNKEAQRCVSINGQIGQTRFSDCEFNGSVNNVGGYIFEILPDENDTTNDNAFMQIILSNCTFQTANKAIYAKKANLILIACHMESIKETFIESYSSLINLQSCNFSQGLHPIIANNGTSIYGSCNKWTAPTSGNFVVNESGSFIFEASFEHFNGEFGSVSQLLPYHRSSGIIVYTNNKTVFLNDTDIINIQQIYSTLKCGETITFVNNGNNSHAFQNKSIEANSYLIWNDDLPSAITLYHGESISFIKVSNEKYLLDSLKVKTKIIDVSIRTGATDVAKVIYVSNCNQILSANMEHNNDLYYLVHNNNITPTLAINSYNSVAVNLNTNNVPVEINLKIRVTYI